MVQAVNVFDQEAGDTVSGAKMSSYWADEDWSDQGLANSADPGGPGPR